MVVLHEVKESAALTCKPWAIVRRWCMASTKLLQNYRLVDFLNLILVLPEFEAAYEMLKLPHIKQ